jgi:hypothetical protein
MRRRGTILLCLAMFAAGAGSVVIVACIIGQATPPNDPSNLGHSWLLREEQPGHLVVPLRGSPPMLVDINCSPDLKTLTSIEVLKGELGSVFKYETNGVLGLPSAQYCGGEDRKWVAWIDLDADGRFDERVDVAKGRMEIWLDDTWTAGVESGRHVKTQEGGLVEFDVTMHKWRAASKIPRQQGESHWPS